ncbi:hypothetical protein EW146_g9986 [Bondarzewia mesenterica]|uniref:Uncharacterized protein n=1 Tax=Bondarzewia mesenterica TaxID=1095465 RepID=A0A4S4L6B7_9AGAM|nr:hypothetical protein EW146_g9986 [Bondarzewia mesenterica]
MTLIIRFSLLALVLYSPDNGHLNRLLPQLDPNYKGARRLSEYGPSGPFTPLLLISPPPPLLANAPKGCLFFCEWGKDRCDSPTSDLTKQSAKFINMATEIGGRDGKGGMVHGIKSLGRYALRSFPRLYSTSPRNICALFLKPAVGNGTSAPESQSYCRLEGPSSTQTHPKASARPIRSHWLTSVGGDTLRSGCARMTERFAYERPM